MQLCYEQICSSCEKVVDKFKKKYKGHKYCSTCYARIFKKRLCSCCGTYARLPKNDDQAICNECIKKRPCIRCNQLNKPIGKLTEYGMVCNSCSVYFRPIVRCERCDAPSQKLTRISRFNDGLRVCPKCSIRDYETCPSCHKYRLLVVDDKGAKICRKCLDQTSKECKKCSVMLPAGYADLCDSCYWHKNLWEKANRNLKSFQYKHLQLGYEHYINWLETRVGAHKAAVYVNKHTHFFIKTEELWFDGIPTAEHLLKVLRTSGLRKFELVMCWLDEVYDIRVTAAEKDLCSHQDQIEKLAASLPQASNAYDIVFAYKNEMYEKMKNGKTSIRSVKLAIKPAVALMHYVCMSGDTLPCLKHVKAYLIDFPGQAAALTGFINFLNTYFSTSIDYLAFKNSRFFNEKRKQKVESEIVKLASKPLNNRDDILSWVKSGVRYFHNVPYVDALKIKYEMITEVEDGYNLLFNQQYYWLPRNNRLT
ncbi:transposase [Acinetobacter baumannii]|uniref:transposase n=1 Tax=Acinetobacter baumannii TaxID=470 RepID=UPI000BF60B9C|nr:transposase [Acinetobacter baumannii]